MKLIKEIMNSSDIKENEISDQYIQFVNDDTDEDIEVNVTLIYNSIRTDYVHGDMVIKNEEYYEIDPDSIEIFLNESFTFNNKFFKKDQDFEELYKYVFFEDHIMKNNSSYFDKYIKDNFFKDNLSEKTKKEVLSNYFYEKIT